jgi:hypothetical protein
MDARLTPLDAGAIMWTRQARYQPIRALPGPNWRHLTLFELATDRSNLSLLTPTGADALVLFHRLGAAMDRIFRNLLCRHARNGLVPFIAALSVTIRQLSHVTSPWTT